MSDTHALPKCSHCGDTKRIAVAGTDGGPLIFGTFPCPRCLPDSPDPVNTPTGTVVPKPPLTGPPDGRETGKGHDHA